jgi:hypothetical protein
VPHLSFGRLFEGDDVSASDYNRLLEVVEALWSQTHPNSDVGLAGVSSRPELAQLLLVQVMSVEDGGSGDSGSGDSGSGDRPRYGWRAVRHVPGNMSPADVEPPFAGDADQLPLYDLSDLGLNVGDVVWAQRGAGNWYETTATGALCAEDAGSGSGPCAGGGTPLSELIQCDGGGSGSPGDTQVRDVCLAVRICGRLYPVVATDPNTGEVVFGG